MAAAAKTVANATRNRWGSEDQRIIEAWDNEKSCFKWQRTMSGGASQSSNGVPREHTCGTHGRSLIN
jgi:hypothetical protein